MRPLEILCLGAGVQSTAVLLMSCLGELPKLDSAIFSDTGWEPKEVYKHLEWLEKFSEEHGIPVHKVSDGNIYKDSLKSTVRAHVDADHTQRWVSIPFRTLNRETGKEGMIRRQCTKEYKLVPIRRKVKELMGLEPRARWPTELSVNQWFGISIDEVTRMRSSEAAWKAHIYPLIDRRLSRGDCMAWLEKRGFTVPEKSACIGCPFHSNREWRAIRKDDEEWKEAVAFDETMRNRGGPSGDLYVHRDCVPLGEADISSAEDKGQLNLFENECEGLCGV